MTKKPRIIVVGGGIAGLMAAVKAAEWGWPVQLFSVVPVRRSGSVPAREGINAAIGAVGEGDSPERHFEDTIEAGDFLANQELPRQMCFKAPEIISLFERMGVMFNRTSCSRTIRAGENTGRQFLYALDEQVRRFEAIGAVEKFEGWEFFSIVKDNRDVCRGIVAMHRTAMEVKAFPADAVIMACGVPAPVFGPSSHTAGGTGLAPSSLYQQGAWYANGEFIKREPMARPGVFWVYSAGGLWIDDNHMTNIPGVFAAGECACRYHGADCLEGNILLSAVFGGMKAGSSAVRYAAGLEKGEAEPKLFSEEVKRQWSINQEILDSEGRENPHSLHQELGEWMTEHVMVVRTNDKLKKTDEKIHELQQRLKKITLADGGNWMNGELIFARQLHNMLELARVITVGALMRNESRGAHYKPEFPDRDDRNFLKTTKARWTPDGPKIEYEDVNLKYLKPVKSPLTPL